MSLLPSTGTDKEITEFWNNDTNYKISWKFAKTSNWNLPHSLDLTKKVQLTFSWKHSVDNNKYTKNIPSYDFSIMLPYLSPFCL